MQLAILFYFNVDTKGIYENSNFISRLIFLAIEKRKAYSYSIVL